MNIIITKNKVDYSSKGFLTVPSLKEAKDIVGNIDFLVYNKSNESSQEKVESLNILKDRVKHVLYICNEKETDLALKMIVLGLNGKYIDDEFFLESAEELNNITLSLDNINELVELGGTNVLSDFLERYLRDGSSEKSFNKNYLSVVKQAVVQLQEEFSQSKLELIKMSESATDLFATTSEVISSAKKEKEKLQSIVQDMTVKLEEKPSRRVSVPSGGSSVLFYPQIQYPKERTIIRIKEIGSVRFLTSWVLGLRIYLESIKNIRPKVIIVEPVGGNIEDKYSEYSWVKQSTKRVKANYYSNVVFTNCPSKEVMTTMLDDGDYDTFIVVDRTTSSKEHILNSKGSPVKYAISGLSVIKKFGLKENLCFSTCTEIPKTMFVIPVYIDYPIDRSARERLYLSNSAKSFDKIYEDVHRR